MFCRLAVAVAALHLTACANERDDRNGTPFRLAASYDAALIPENVVLKLQNDSDQYLCVPLVETRVGGNLKLVPKSDDDEFANRRPDRALGGVDIGEGVAVVPPHKREEFFVHLGEHFKSRVPAATELRGTIRAVGCRALFSDPQPQLTAREFTVKLLPSPTQP